MAFSADIKRRIISDNLHMQERTISQELEVRRSHLADLVSVLTEPYRAQRMTPDILREIGSDAVLAGGEVPALHREVRPDVKEGVAAALSHITSYDRAVVAELICSHAGMDGHPLTASAFLHLPEMSTRIAYARNAYTDEAYDAFSESLVAPTALFTDSYEEACREIVEGNCGYCILPWRDTNGDYHRATLSYLEVYHLMATSVVTVTDGEDVPMQFALIGRAPTTVPTIWEMVLIMPPDSTAEKVDLLSVAAHFNIEVVSLFASSEGRGIQCTLRGKGDATPILTWLCLFAPTYQLRGFYPCREEIES